jgi:ribosomal protein S18 acetylase RimI-like enzyme
MTITLEPAADEELLYALFAIVRTEELAMASWPSALREQLLRTQFRVQQEGCRRSHGSHDTHVIVSDGRPVGWVIVDRGGAELHGIDLGLIAEARGAGIGTEIIRALQHEAQATQRSMVLDVQRTNARAVALYERLGFRTVSMNDTHLFMRWTGEE